ncbi:MAG TPA: hypothetical protein VH089_04405 [Streptosporangiaceae bacterium]|nr:hypothetical protein [Streptosporangiaceae bacterium]
MTKYTDNLWRDLVREHGATFAHVSRPEPRRVRRPRTQIIAGSTLVLAAVGTALALALTAPARTAASGGTSAAAGKSQVHTAAYTITRNDNGSVLVQVSQKESIVLANNKLTTLGIHEQFDIYMASGPAPVEGAVACQPQPGVSGPPVKVLLASNGTEVIEPGTTGGNTGVGTWHIASCKTFKTGDTGPGTGNSGAGPTAASPAAG